MKAKAKKIKEEESPLDLARRLRHEYFSKFDYDYDEIFKDLKKGEEKYKHRVIDPKTLPQK